MHRLGPVVVALHRVGCCQDGGASWQAGHQASLGHRHLLLLHRLKQGLQHMGQYTHNLDLANDVQNITTLHVMLDLIDDQVIEYSESTVSMMDQVAMHLPLCTAHTPVVRLQQTQRTPT